MTSEIFELIDKVQDIITLFGVPIAVVLLCWILVEVRKFGK